MAIKMDDYVIHSKELLDIFKISVFFLQPIKSYLNPLSASVALI